MPEISDIVNEVLGFFLAASETTSLGSVTMLSYFIKNPSGLKKVRDEFDHLYKSALKDDPSLADKSRLEVLNAIINAETQDSYEYTKLVNQEVLRF